MTAADSGERFVTISDEITQTLEEDVSELKLRLNKLDQENRDLRDICNAYGVPYEEQLAVRRHKRYFAHLCTDGPCHD